MQLSLQNFTTLVQNMAASAQGACADLADVTVGSVTRALLEASASVALWLQFLTLQVLTMTRLSTSNGADVDSWVGDFGLARLPGTPSEGFVTMSSLAPQSQSAVVPVGTIVKTADGLLSFQVIQDITNTAWSSAAGAYVRPAGTASITVPVQAAIAGASGNIQPGIINLLGQTVTGIDTVTNSLPLTSGLDAESDSSLRSRFVGYVNSRSRATVAAIENAVLAVQQGLTTVVLENTDASGAARIGSITVIVDDGTGSPGSVLLQAVSEAVDAVRPVGSIIAVKGPVLLTVDVSMTLSLAVGSTPATVQQNVIRAVASFIDGLPVGGVLPYTRLASVAYQADANVVNVFALTLNGQTSDTGGSVGEVVRVGTITVS